jgi:alkylation response protein AidB-like acyl-CoA dehydrogenase
MFVPYAHTADYIICPARIDRKDRRGEVSLFLVEAKTAGIEMTPLLTLDLQKQYEVTFRDAVVPKTGLIGEEGKGWALIQDLWPYIVTAKCCEMLGAMQQILEMTVDYAQTRRQFGQPISAFQVIQHYIADMAIDLEGSKFITYQAAWRLSRHLPSKKGAAMAKLWCGGALKKK